jgi:hypothetical protein
MTGHLWLDVLIGIAVALLLTWLLLVVALVVGRPKGKLLSESMRLCQTSYGCCAAWPLTGASRRVCGYGWACCWPTWRCR